MKLTSLIAVLIFSLSAFAGGAEMKELLRVTNGYIYAGNVPTGYTSRQVKDLIPKGAVVGFLKRVTKQKMKDWREYVMTSGEFDGSQAELMAIAAAPLETLQVDSLLEVTEVFAIYKNGRLIGYALEIQDYVQAAIYQDGAWFDVFVDENFNVVHFSAESA